MRLSSQRDNIRDCYKQRKDKNNTPGNACISLALFFCLYAATAATEMKRSEIEVLLGTSQKCGVSFLLLKWRKYRIYGLPGGFGGLMYRNKIA